jgi:Flp pilus assembly protein TadD
MLLNKPIDRTNLKCTEPDCNQGLHGNVRFCPFCGTSTGNSDDNVVVKVAKARPQSKAKTAAASASLAQSERVNSEPNDSATPTVAQTVVRVATANSAKHGNSNGESQDLPPEITGQVQQTPAERPQSKEEQLRTKTGVAPHFPVSAEKPASKKKSWLVAGMIVIALVYIWVNRGVDDAPSDSVVAQATPKAQVSRQSAPLRSPAGNERMPTGVPPAKPIQEAPPSIQAELKIDEVLAPIPTKYAESQLLNMLANARDTEMTAVLGARRSLQQLVYPPRGDRKTARDANAKGLDALRRDELIEATSLFAAGVKADPADQEIVNNLAFSLHKQGRLLEARLAAIATLTLAPERTPAWANLAQVLADSGDTERAVSAFLLAAKFSTNPVKNRDFLQSLAQEDPSVQVRDAAGKALALLTPPLAPAMPQPPFSAPAPTFSAPAAPVRDNSGIINGMVDEGETCMAAKKYDCAITSARSALRIDSNNGRASQLLRNAEREQRKAMDSITIN